jgi:hypothetical protein
MKPLSESAAPFAQPSEPSELAYEIAGIIEHMLLKPRLHAYTVSELARAIEPEIAQINKKCLSLENAVAAACQTALIHGASEEEMRCIGRMIEEGDKLV